MEKVKKFVADHQDMVTSVTQVLLCVVFLIATATGAAKQKKK